MGNTERQSERSTQVFGDLLYSAKDSKLRAIGSLGLAVLALPFAFRKGHRVLPIIAASAFGATGEVSDWNLARKIVEVVKVPVILAGGLGPENVC